MGKVTPDSAGCPAPRSSWLLAGMLAAAGPATLEMAAIHLTALLDLLWLGRIGPAAIAAAAVGASARWAGASLAIGLGVGGMAVVARRVGEQDDKAASAAAWQTILLCLAATASVSIAGVALAAPLLRCLGVEEEVRALGLGYLGISFAGLLPLAFLLTVNALWRGVGAAATARQVLWLATGVSLVLDPLLVLGWGRWDGLGAAGSALAAVIGPAVGAAVQVALLRRGRTRLWLGRGTMKLAPGLLWHILCLGAGSSLQLALRAAARLALLGVIARFGTAALAGYAIANAMLIVALVPTSGLGYAGAALVVGSLAAGWPRQAMLRARIVTAMNVAYVTGAVALLFSFAPQAVGVWSAVPGVLACGADALRLVGLGYVSSALGVVKARAHDAAGQSIPTGLTNLLTLWGIQIPLAVLLSRLLGPAGLWLGVAIAGMANGLLMSYHLRRGRSSLMRW